MGLGDHHHLPMHQLVPMGSGFWVLGAGQPPTIDRQRVRVGRGVQFTLKWYFGYIGVVFIFSEMKDIWSTTVQHRRRRLSQGVASQNGSLMCAPLLCTVISLSVLWTHSNGAVVIWGCREMGRALFFLGLAGIGNVLVVPVKSPPPPSATPTAECLEMQRTPMRSVSDSGNPWP